MIVCFAVCELAVCLGIDLRTQSSPAFALDAEKRERNEKPTIVVPLLGYEQMNKVDGRRDKDYDMMIWLMVMLLGGGASKGRLMMMSS